MNGIVTREQQIKWQGRFHISFNLNPRPIANDYSNLDRPEDFVRTGYRKVGASVLS